MFKAHRLCYLRGAVDDPIHGLARRLRYPPFYHTEALSYERGTPVLALSYERGTPVLALSYERGTSVLALSYERGTPVLTLGSGTCEARWTIQSTSDLPVDCDIRPETRVGVQGL